MPGQTVLGIDGARFTINGRPTYAGRDYRGWPIEGLLMNVRFKGRWILRSIVILPWALTTIVNGTMWRWIYNPEYGALNALLTQVHILPHYRSWLGSPFLLAYAGLDRVYQNIEAGTGKIEPAFNKPPESPYVSGSAQSHVSWRTMGREGRRPRAPHRHEVRQGARDRPSDRIPATALR